MLHGARPDHGNVPTLDMLAQTAQAWRAAGHRVPMVAVCSLENDPVLTSLGVRTTTNPIQLALWAGTGPVIAFATYASLVDREDQEDPKPGQQTVRGPLEAALTGGERVYGQQMAPFDLAIVGKAHSTAGESWQAVGGDPRQRPDPRRLPALPHRHPAHPRPARREARPPRRRSSRVRPTTRTAPSEPRPPAPSSGSRGPSSGVSSPNSRSTSSRPSPALGGFGGCAAGLAPGAPAGRTAGARRGVQPPSRHSAQQRAALAELGAYLLRLDVRVWAAVPSGLMDRICCSSAECSDTGCVR
jgi:hypothetical protein